jgi:uncharacterized FlaG/YvyC family protein
MSINISSVGPPEARQVPSSGATRSQRTAPAAPSAASADSVKVDTLPSSPPPEVHAAMNVAADAYEKLKAEGRQLSFQLDDATGKLHIEVHDLHGQVLFTVPPSKVLDVASGGSL